MIRTVTPLDAPQIAEIYQHYVLNTVISFETEPVSPAGMSTRITDVLAQGLPWLVIEDAGRICGYAYASKWRPRPAYRHSLETTVYLAKEQVGRGFGRAIYTRLLAELAQGGCHTALGVIALPNQSSITLHEKLGFKKTAHFQEVGRKFDRWVDVGFWQLML